MGPGHSQPSDIAIYETTRQIHRAQTKIAPHDRMLVTITFYFQKNYKKLFLGAIINTTVANLGLGQNDQLKYPLRYPS